MLGRFGLSRLGLSGRLVLIVLLVTLLALALGGGLSYIARERRTPRASPLPEQIAAIVDLVDVADSTRRATVLRAVNARDLAVTISPSPPQLKPESNRLPTVEWMVSQYLSRPHGHDVIALMEPRYPNRPLARLLERWSPASQLPLTIAVNLAGGGYAVFTTRGSPATLVFGMPPGFWIGTLGALLAILAVRAVMREARPLKQLETAVTAFAADAKPRPVPEGGAPDLRRVIVATNTMQSRIATLIKARGMLLAAISHDLRTYLTRLRLRVDTIEDESARARAVRDVDDMASLIEDSLAVGRGLTTADGRDRIDLIELASAEIAERADGRARFAESSLSRPVLVLGDAMALRRVLANLMDNALRFGTRVEVSVSIAQDHAIVAVDDDGPGIPEDERENIFEPFYRGDTSRSRTTGGSGLGLAIARQIIEAHGGSIAATRSALGGASLVVRLPLAQLN